jgi:hypothetical protein
VTTTTHGPFASFQQLIADAKKRAPYVEAAFHVCLEEQIFEHIDGTKPVHHAEEIIDRLAKQCGLVIDAKYFHGRTRFTYQLTEAEVFGEQFETA